MSTICRICLQTINVNNTTNLFTTEERSKDILQKISLCFKITIEFNKNLPTDICNVCIDQLESANKFRLKCLTFEEKFKSLCQVSQEFQIMYLYPSELVKVDPINDEYHNDFYEDSDEKIIEIDNEQNNQEIFYNYNKLKLNNSINNKNFKCGICSKILKTEVSLRKHVMSMHQKRRHIGNVTGFGTARRYHCTKCSYSTPHSQTLVHHMRRHDGERPYQCECGKGFTQPSSLSAHRKVHSSAVHHVCYICGKQFKHTFSLKKHQHVHESGKFSCDVCHKVLKSKESLKNHIRRHYNIRNYNCEDCGDTFVTASELTNHKKIHNTEKNVECHMCGYKTHAKRLLIIHLKRHAGDKAFKCNTCDQTFCTRGDLTRHKRVHTRIKPFPCPTCAQRFTHSTSLNKHMRNTHGVHYKWADFKRKDNRKVTITIKDEN